MSTPKPAVALVALGYTAPHRAYEICGIVATLTTGAWLCQRLSSAGSIAPYAVPLAIVLGMLGADLVSGVVHWAFDTWGDVDTPFVGRFVIRAFREHHVDTRALLTHDFVETNGHNFALALTLTWAGLWVVPAQHASARSVLVGLTLLSMACFVSITSQIHKWAHADRPPRVVAWLQRARILLSPAHHRRHHDAPHVQNYCITTGWLDEALRVSRAFERLERFVESVTGFVPRRRDQGAR